MATNLSAGAKADVTISNVTVESVNADSSFVLVRLPDNGNGTPFEMWLPSNDPRVAINLIAPSNWPPKENDVWIVPGITPPAFVVANEAGQLYFLTADAIRQSYNDKASTLPPTVQDALNAYGNQLTLLYRLPPTA